ncbi:hypothetical protein KUTeg_005789 [Tegillarca granosa]|uniref:THAP-type domain-containing protein n=1 Tax=Tegillarca granosa TaxID=220873 RepID=A0ABQ9FK73_TEGGR|nr:hypothetical protein KUTeg_005789 [Tegillarca granosa]
MVKHCSHGSCKSDSRYPDKLNGAIGLFIPFAKPRTDLDKCLRWISLCRRPHSQLNKEKITKHIYLHKTALFTCNTLESAGQHMHFITLEGPTLEYPDPSDCYDRRTKTVKETNTISGNRINKFRVFKVRSLEILHVKYIYIYEENRPEDSLENVLSSLDMLSHVSRIRQLEEENEELRKDNIKLKIELDSWIKNSRKSTFVKACQTNTNFNFNSFNTTQFPIKNLLSFIPD